MATPITDLEQAINFWRAQAPAQGEERRLGAQTAVLAEVYALMIFHRRAEFDPAGLAPEARAAFDAWRDSLGRHGVNTP